MRISSRRNEPSFKGDSPHPTIKNFGRFIERNEIFGRHIGLNVVNRVENESAFAAENFDPLADFFADFLGRSERKRFLRIDAAPQKVICLPNFPSAFADPFWRQSTARD